MSADPLRHPRPAEAAEPEARRYPAHLRSLWSASNRKTIFGGGSYDTVLVCGSNRVGVCPTRVGAHSNLSNGVFLWGAGEIHNACSKRKADRIEQGGRGISGRASTI